MHLVARARHVVARRPWLYWLVVVALAGGVGLITAGAVAGIDDARARGVRRGRCSSLSTDLSPGDALAGRTELRPRPVPMVPEDAIDARGRRVRSPASTSPLARCWSMRDVVSGTLPAALIPAGWQGVPVAEAVPSGAGSAIGSRSPAQGRCSPPTAWSSGADSGPIVAVPADEAPSVAHAAASGELVRAALTAAPEPGVEVR